MTSLQRFWLDEAAAHILSQHQPDASEDGDIL